MDIGSSGIGLNAEASSQTANGIRRWNYYVDGALGNDNNNGSIQSPFQTIQRAINAADESNNPGENNILIAKGHYRENLSISDNDLVRLVGRTKNPFDVVVQGFQDPIESFASTAAFLNHNTIDIDGGDAVVLKNMRVTGGQQGIQAYDLNQLKLYNIVAEGNFDDGLDTESVHSVSIFHSKFFGNQDDGADIYDSNEVSIWYSEFNGNGDEGLELFDNSRAGLYHVTAANNRDDGLDLEYINEFHVQDSYFTRNGDDGMDLVESIASKFYRTSFVGNGENGIEMFYNGNVEFYNSRAVNNGVFEDVVDDFQGTFDPDLEFELGNGIAAHETETIKIQLGTFSDNYNDGVLLEYTGEAKFYNPHVKGNGDDGIDAFLFGHVASWGGYFSDNVDDGIDFGGTLFLDTPDAPLTSLEEPNNPELFGQEAHVKGGRFYDNGDEGVAMFNLSHAYVHGIDGRYNGSDAVEISNSYKAEVAHSFTSFNDDDGVSFNDNVNTHVMHVVSKNNIEDGMDVDGGVNVHVKGGVFSENGEDGLDLDGIEFNPLNNVHLGWVTATRNRADGLDIYQARDLHVEGGYFVGNNENGLEIEDVYNVELKHVISRYNHQNGLFVDGFDFRNGEPALVANGEIHQTHINIYRGSFSRNWNDGIQLFGVGDVELENVFGIENGDDGIDVFGANVVELGESIFRDNGNLNVRIDLDGQV